MPFDLFRFPMRQGTTTTPKNNGNQFPLFNTQYWLIGVFNDK